MLKKLFFISCFIGFISTANAQFIHSVEYKAGGSVSTLDWHIFSNYGLQNHMYKENFDGFSSAFTINYLDHTYWNISSQLSFLQTGGKDKAELISPSAPDLNIVIQNKINYVSFNSFIKLKYPVKRFIPFLKVGPHIDYMISATNYSVDFTHFNYGLNLTAGYDIKLNDNIYLTSDINYIWFLNKLEATNIEVSFTRFSSVLFGIGYTFN